MRITKRLMAVLVLSLTVSACGSGESSQDGSAKGATSEISITVQAKSLSENGQNSTIEVFLNGTPVSDGPVSVSAAAEKDYVFATAERLDSDSIVDVLVDNAQETKTSLLVSSVMAGDLILNPSDAYFDKGLKEAAFDGEDLADGTPIVTGSGALRFLMRGAARARTSQNEKAQSRWCTGKPNQNLDAAKLSFRDECAQIYSDQLGHKCDYKSDGFHCNGMVSDTSAPDKPTDTTNTQTPLNPGMAYCYGEYQDAIGNAKNYVYPNCGVSYQKMLTPQCVWSSLGWRCGGQVPKDKLPVNPYSSLCERYGTFLEVRAPKDLVVSRMSDTQMLVQWKAQDCENRNFNIWQNGVKVASNHPYNYVIRQVPINKTIEFQVSTWEYLHRFYYTQESPKTGKVAFEISDGLKNCEQIGSAKRYRCDAIAGSLKSTLKSGSMVLVPTDIGDTVLYAGPLDDGGLCTLHVPGGADESLTTGLVGWTEAAAANDSCRKDGKSCSGDGGDGGGGGGGGGGGKPVVEKPDFVCGKDNNGNAKKCI